MVINVRKLDDSKHVFLVTLKSLAKGMNMTPCCVGSLPQQQREAQK